MNRQEAILLAQKIKQIRHNKLDVPTLLRLRDMPRPKRDYCMDMLVKKGYADSVDDIVRMMMSREVCRYVTAGDSPLESTGMSDDRLDRGIGNVYFNNDML